MSSRPLHTTRAPKISSSVYPCFPLFATAFFFDGSRGRNAGSFATGFAAAGRGWMAAAGRAGGRGFTTGLGFTLDDRRRRGRGGLGHG